MTDSMDLTQAFDARAQRREERRAFFKSALGAVAVGAAGAATLGLANEAAAQTTTLTDADVLNFALNLEYLEAQFYSFAANGVGLDNSLLTGTGTQGAVTGGRAVDFAGTSGGLADPIIGRYAREIAADEAAHVAFLRSALGSSAVAMPTIDLSVGPNSAFSKAAVAAKIIASGATFDPYASVENFLLGAFIFEDVGVTAYKGSIALITNKTYIEAAAGIHAVEAYHAATIRQELYRKGIQTPNANLITWAGGISDARDGLDGGTDIDQGIATATTTITNADSTTTTLNVSNIVPTDANGITYSRSAAQVLNIVYLNSAAVSSGGFFPNGVTGTIKTSAASA